MRSEDETRRFMLMQGNVMLHQRDYAKMGYFFAVFDKQQSGPVASIRSKMQNKTAYIGATEIDEEHRARRAAFPA